MRRIIELALATNLVPKMPAFPPRAFRAVRPLLGDDPDRASMALAGLDPAFREAGMERLAHIALFKSELDRLAQIGITVVLEGDRQYPERWVSLANAKPTAIFAAGETELLSMRMAGVVGSRDPSDASKATAESLGKHAKDFGLGIVSGGAKGVDEIAVRAALESGAKCAVICGDSLEKLSGHFRSEIASKSLCICSPFSPRSSFSVGNAMARNKLIYRTALLTAAVEFKPGTGGTWAGAVEALKSGRDRVAVFSEFRYAKLLADKGAILVADTNDFFAQIASSSASNLFA